MLMLIMMNATRPWVQGLRLRLKFMFRCGRNLDSAIEATALDRAHLAASERRSLFDLLLRSLHPASLCCPIQRSLLLTLYLSKLPQNLLFLSSKLIEVDQILLIDLL